MIVNLGIKNWASISPMGCSTLEVLESYKTDATALTYNARWQGKLAANTEAKLQQFLEPQRLYKKLDRSAQLGTFVANQLREKESSEIKANCGVFAGSSRGATGLLEAGFKEYMETGKAPAQTSPHTTAGNIASFIAQCLGGGVVEQSYSITCSTFSHGVANAAAWLKSDMVPQMAVFGCEAPLTPFTFSQMEALGIYSREPKQEPFPCKALNTRKKHNTMLLGEGAFGILLEKNDHTPYYISAIGMAKEHVSSAAGVTPEGQGIYDAMRQITTEMEEPIDAVVTHAPGTLLGDSSELHAIQRLFSDEQPAITNNKWKIGHTFGASAGLSVEMALLMLQEQSVFYPPYLNKKKSKQPLRHILVNAIGFGGNAISMCISRRD